MNDANKKVLLMVEQGKISAREGDELIEALNAKKPLGLRVLFDSYPRIGLFAGLAIGIGVAVLSFFSQLVLDVRFDGFLDLHAPSGFVTIEKAFADQVVSWPLSALVLWVVALMFRKEVRFIDFLSTLGIARGAMLIGGLLTVAVSPSQEVLQSFSISILADPKSIGSQLVQMIPMTIAAITCITWFSANAVFAFKHASGLRKGKLAIALVLATILAETVSKLSLTALGSIF